MSRADVKALRMGLLRIVKLMVEEAPAPDEVKAMMLYVQVRASSSFPVSSLSLFSLFPASFFSFSYRCLNLII